MQTFLFGAVDIPFKANSYNGALLYGHVLAVVTDNSFQYPSTETAVADFVSDCIYWLNSQGERPEHVMQAQKVGVDRLVHLMTRTLVEAT